MTDGAPAYEPQQCDDPNESPSRGPRLSRSELRRRLWHMSPGVLPFALWFYPHRDPISPTLYAIMVALVVGLAVGVFVGYRHIERRGESKQRLAAVAGYAASVLLTLIAFPAHAELGLSVLAVLAFGDGSATLGGLLIGGPKLPWNRGKTVSGLLCFLVVGGSMASLVYWGETFFNHEALEPKPTIPAALLCGGLAALLAGLVESIPSEINDNIRVGLAAAATLAVTHGLAAGWG